MNLTEYKAYIVKALDEALAEHGEMPVVAWVDHQRRYSDQQAWGRGVSIEDEYFWKRRSASDAPLVDLAGGRVFIIADWPMTEDK